MTDWTLIAAFVGMLAIAALALAIAKWRQRRKLFIKGKNGEKMVAKVLSSLGSRDFIVLNDLLLPSSSGSTSQIDHVVVSTRGIFVIETKSHAGLISGSEQAQYWKQNLSSGSKTFYNPLLQNRSHMRAIKRLLSGLDDDLLSSVVVFTDARKIDIKADDIVVKRTLLPDKRIKRTLVPSERRKKRWWRSGKEVVLDEHKIVITLDGLANELRRRRNVIERSNLKKIAGMLLAANIKGYAARREHTGYAKNTARNMANDIKKGVCPRCGARLVKRKSKQGEFVGCSRYPECRFTCSVDRIPD